MSTQQISCYEKCTGGKLSKERITVFVTASMAGKKLPPLVIGKSANPRCFKNVKKLPLLYEHNNKAWITSTIFEKWVKKLDLKWEKVKKNCLVLDNCTDHPNVSGLTNIMLVFLPPNTTSKTQPVDAGVIRRIKAHHRKNLRKLRLLAFEKKPAKWKMYHSIINSFAHITRVAHAITLIRDTFFILLQIWGSGFWWWWNRPCWWVQKDETRPGMVSSNYGRETFTICNAITLWNNHVIRVNMHMKRVDCLYNSINRCKICYCDHVLCSWRKGF